MAVTSLNTILVLGCRRRRFAGSFARFASSGFNLPPLCLDVDFYLDPRNTAAIRRNMEKRRNSSADIEKIIQMQDPCSTGGASGRGILHMPPPPPPKLINELAKVPNMTHPSVFELSEPRLVTQKQFPQLNHKVRTFEEICAVLGASRLKNLSHCSGERTYYLIGVLAKLEQALIRWTIDVLRNKGFSLISVPDILHPDIIERCGMTVSGGRSQVYQLSPEFGQAALSGTSEMALGGYLMSKRLNNDDLPLKLCAISRCYRAEASQNKFDKGLYRVHQFNKVEMFLVTNGQLVDSQKALHEVLDLEREMFDQLGLAYRVLDMSPDELGNPATRKFDIEAWMPGRKFWGEISSCSDCTDYQSRRLDIRDSNERFCHTVNGTACAVPRMIIAICEQRQNSNGSVSVPSVLQPYLENKTILEGKPRKHRPNLVYISSANFFKNKKSI